jgi:signal peptidase I
MAKSGQPKAPQGRQHGHLQSLIETVITVVIAILVALGIQAFLVKPYRIPSGSMIPTLSLGQRILVNRLSRHPHIGEVVVFHPPIGADPANAVCGDPAQGAGHKQACDKPLPAESKQTFVKRVVGSPGDHLRIASGYVYRNGVKETGSYIQQCDSSGATYCDFPTTITVPTGEYYMMGDNRSISDDSRFWGPIPQQWIIGDAFFTYWPFSRLGFM